MDEESNSVQSRASTTVAKLNHMGLPYDSKWLDPLDLKELTPEQKEIAALLVLGLEDDHKGLGLIAGKPLTAEEAAEVMGVRRRYVRRLQQSPVFMAECSSLLAAFRRGEHARSIHTLVEIRDDRTNKAADRITASRTILGEESKGVSISIQNNQLNIQKPGYVIRAPQPKEPMTIEGNAE